MVNKSSGTSDADHDSSERQDEPEQTEQGNAPEQAAGATDEPSSSSQGETEANTESEAEPKPAKSKGELPADEKEEAADTAARAVTVDSVPKKPRVGTEPRRRKRRSTATEPLSEEEIDSPSKQTLGMLGVVAAATLVMWGVGRAKCNYHEVGEGMKPREVTLEERTRAPKEVAFEFQHALASYDLDTAAKLATGAAKELIEERKKACAGGSCAKKQESLAGKVHSVSELLKRTPTHSVARAWSVGSDVAPTKHVLVLKRMGKDWKVESYQKGTGENVEVPGMNVGYPQGASEQQAPPGLPGAHPRLGAAPQPHHEHPATGQNAAARPPAAKAHGSAPPPAAPKGQMPAQPAPPAPPAQPAPKAPAAPPKSDKPAPVAPKPTSPTPAQ